MHKFLDFLKWFFKFTKIATLRYLVTAELTEEEYKLLLLVHKTQWQKYNTLNKKHKEK